MRSRHRNNLPSSDEAVGTLAQQNRLRLLTETEKIQLLELQKTRERILKELNKQPNGQAAILGTMHANDPLAEINFNYHRPPANTRLMMEQSAFGAKKKTAKRKVREIHGAVTATDYINNLKTGLDMVPIMASSGEPAMDVGLRGKGTIKLPVFKLPALSTEAINPRVMLSSRGRSPITPASGRRSRGKDGNIPFASYEGELVRFIPVSDSDGFRRALLMMIRALREDEYTFIKYYIDISDEEMDDIEKELSKYVTRQGAQHTPPSQQRKLVHSGDNSDSSAGASSRTLQNEGSVELHPGNKSSTEPSLLNSVTKEIDKSLWTDFFGVDPDTTVFNLSKDVVLSNLAEKNSYQSQVDSVYNKAMKNIDLSVLGLSEEFSQFLPTDGGFANDRVSGGAAKSNSGLTIRPNSKQSLPPLKRLSSMPQLYKNKVNTLSVAYTSNNDTSFLRQSNTAHGKSHPSIVGKGDFASTLPEVDFHTNRKTLIAPAAELSRSTGRMIAPRGTQSKRSLRHTNGAQHPKITGKLKKQLLVSRDILDPSVKYLRASQRPQHAEDAGELTQALLLSLSSMQEHTSMIKQSLSQAQNIVGIEDPKARHLVFSVAAEKLRMALSPLLLIELRRGFTAWVFSVRQVRRQEKVSAFFKFLAERNLVLGLHEILLRRLRLDFECWKDFTAAEIQRIRTKRIKEAAIRLQTAARGYIARVKVNAMKMRRKYQRLYDATIKIQALMRGKVTKWRFHRENRAQLERKHAKLIQRVLRGYFARKRVYNIRIRHDKAAAATAIQRIIRGHQAHNLVKKKLHERRLNQYATKIQSLARGFIARRNIKQILIDRSRYRHATAIQALVRGVISRKNLAKRILELQQYREHRSRCATRIQAAYRGYRDRLYYQMMIYKVRKVKGEQYKAATEITRIVRGFNARALLRQLRNARLEQWVMDAREWQESWSEDQENWYYYNSKTDEAVWEPLRQGYTRHDGMLVLASGEIIEDPVKLREAEEAELAKLPFDEDEEERKEKTEKKKLSKLCTECMDRIATRACNECGDKYCTKCYKYVHATGSRRKHTYAPLGPIDCTECELRLAERWCVSCDESFCDNCWRKVHGKGKRAYHPYSEISPEGRIDQRIFTMDGDQVNDYDSSYSQQRMDLDSFNAKQTEVQHLANALVPVAEESEWQGYYEQQGYEESGSLGHTEGGYAHGGDSQAWTDGYYDENGNYSEYSPLSPQQSMYEQYGQDESMVPYDANGNDAYSMGYGDYTKVGSDGSQMISYAGWTQYSDDNGYPYWFNHDTGVSQYEDPYQQ